MANKKQVQVKDLPNNTWGDQLLKDFLMQRAARKSKASSPILWLSGILIAIALFTGTSYFALFAPAQISQQTIPPSEVIAQEPVTQPEMLHEPENVAPENQSPAEPQTISVEPTVNPNLIGVQYDLKTVTAVALAQEFQKRITVRVQPTNVGLATRTSGNAVFDAVVRLKESYGNTESPELMEQTLRENSEYIKVAATNGDPIAVALRQATFMEFSQDTKNAIERISSLSATQLFPAANDIGYYTTAMWYLANSDTEREDGAALVKKAADAFAQRVIELHTEKTTAEAQSKALAAAELQQAESQQNAAQNAAPAEQAQAQEIPESVAAPDPAELTSTAAMSEMFPQTETRQLTQDVMAITMATPEMTDYSNFPQNIAAPLVDFNGWSLNPEGVALVVQQFSALLQTGTAGDAGEWVVWNTYAFGQNAWSFVLIKRTTLDARWSELPAACQNYMGALIENPDREDAAALRSEWLGLNACADYLGGNVFNEGSNILQTTAPSGATDYWLHKGQDGLVDVMGAVWFGWEDFPLKVGNRIRPRSIVNKGEELFKSFFP